jgi:serine protease AprX
VDRRFLLKLTLAFGLAAMFFLTWLTAICTVSVAQPVNVASQVWTDLQSGKSAATVDGDEAEFLVVLAEQADLTRAAALRNREVRLRYVYDTLRETALRTQAPLRAELDAAGVEYRSFHIINMLAMKGNHALAASLAARPEVARIAANPRVRQPLPSPSPRGDELRRGQTGIEWNVAHVNADDVWALGYTGQGIVVAGQDTGYDWDHPALVNQYRGYNGITATHDYNWHDAIHENDPHTPGGNPCGFDSPVPCDDHGHGTHTIGTLVGDDGTGNRIGVAPGARWIGCRNMEQGWGTPETYAECFEFFLAPYPIGGDPITDGVPSLAPHVINNSWICPPSEGCDWATLQTVVENVRAAGIVVVAAAGNSGSACNTVRDPPAIYDAALSVGATDSSDNIAGFSSRGPVTADGSGRRKPDISAPGVSVRSSIPGGGYTTMQGTSMAAPHVAGTVALLWSATPHLVGDVDTAEEVITLTARPRTTTQCCGDDSPGDVPNNVYGWGIVDALAAVESVRPKAEIAKQATFPVGVPARLLVYTLTVTNTSTSTLTQVVLTDAIPVSTTFAWASGGYIYADGVVTWTAESLTSQETLTATFAVTVEHLPRGTIVINDAYGVHADETAIPIMGVPVEATIPWRYVLFPVLRNWPPREDNNE